MGQATGFRLEPRATSRSTAGSGARHLHHALIGVAAAGPSVAGLCTLREEGRAGVRRLLTSLLAWRLPARWYVLALGGPLAVALLSVAGDQLAVGDDIFSELEATTVLLVPIALVAAACSSRSCCTTSRMLRACCSQKRHEATSGPTSWLPH